MDSFFRNRFCLHFCSFVSGTLLALAPSVVTSSAAAQAAPTSPQSTLQPAPEWDDSSIEPRVEELLKEMTIEEKVGQLVQYSAGQPTGPGTGRTDYNDMLAKGQIGALFNIVTAKESNAFQRIAV